MGNDFRLQLKFWGVRGSTPTPQIENLSYGGNTSCLEVRLPNDEVFIFDGGTGIRSLGLSLVEEFKKKKLDLKLFLTHFHWDHIQGIPFFAPLYNPENKVSFHSFRTPEGLEGMLKGQMTTPYFPVSFEFLPAKTDFFEIGKGEVRYGDVRISPFQMNHPQGAIGYRIERKGAVIVYASDLEHGHKQLDQVVREYAQDADILIYDAQYTPEEYKNHVGWGHSTWLEGTRVANEAKAKQLILFHHDPSHSDQMFFNVVQEARLHFGNTLGAKEGSYFIL